VFTVFVQEALDQSRSADKRRVELSNSGAGTAALTSAVERCSRRGLLRSAPPNPSVFPGGERPTIPDERERLWRQKPLFCYLKLVSSKAFAFNWLRYGFR
jgi:hypothetical protein